MRRTLFGFGVLVSVVLGGVAWWRRHPRVGTAWVNRVVDPWLVRQGVIEGSEGELGLDRARRPHVGIVRITPVHPVRTANGFRIIVPLGLESQWAQNVMRAGRCRLQVGGLVYELDEPMMLSPRLVAEVPPAAARLMSWLGFQYLELRRFAELPGTVAAPVDAAEAEIEPGSSRSSSPSDLSHSFRTCPASYLPRTTP